MDTITIVCSDNFVKVEQGRLPKSRRRYYSPVLEVFVSGRVRPHQMDMVKYHAVSEALARGGRVVDVRRVDCGCGVRKAPKQGAPEMFDLDRENE